MLRTVCEVKEGVSSGGGADDHGDNVLLTGFKVNEAGSCGRGVGDDGNNMNAGARKPDGDDGGGGAAATLLALHR